MGCQKNRKRMKPRTFSAENDCFTSLANFLHGELTSFYRACGSCASWDGARSSGGYTVFFQLICNLHDCSFITDEEVEALLERMVREGEQLGKGFRDNCTCYEK